MANCAPIRVAQAVAAEINAAVEDGTLSKEFTAAFSFADAITKLEDVNAVDGLLVDVLPTQKPTWSLASSSGGRHTVTVKVGIRRRIQTTDRNTDGTIKSAEVTAYCNLLYEILAIFAAGATATHGRALTTEPSAVWDPRQPLEILLYDEAKLKQGLYVGWIHLPFLVHEEVAT